MENNNILVSVIVPIYGTEAYLPACIDSIRGQSYTNLQIILVDDQSPDGCPEICDRYAQMDSRILVIHQENKGVSGARNTGMCHATGEYIMFVDSDDELYPDAVKILLQDAITYEADIVSAIKRSGEKGQKILNVCKDGDCTIYQGKDVALLSLAGEKNTGSACAKLFKSELLRDIRFVEGKNIHEDGFFIFLCYMKRPVLVQHDVPIYQYNIRLGSGSREAFSDKYLSMLYLCERKKELIAARYPQYTEQAHNMEVRTNLQFLDILCRTTEKKYKDLQKRSIRTVCRLYQYHKPINDHHRMLAWVVKYGLYPLYKWAVRMKYYR